MWRGKSVRAAAVCVAAALIGPAAAAQDPGAIAIVGATVFDATGAAPRVANVIIRDGRIVAVGPKARAPRGAKVIDAKGKALLPELYQPYSRYWYASIRKTF